MSTCEEKKALPPFEQPLGGVFPDEIAKIKQIGRGGRQKRLKAVLALTGVLVVVLLVVGGTLLGVYLNRESFVSRTLKFRDGDKVYYETVETDEDDGTDTFYTEGINGVAAVMFDHKKGLKAFTFSGRNFCYIVPEKEGEEENAKEVAKHMENKEEGSTEQVRNSGSMKMCLDESRTDAPELSEAMEFFCGDLQPRWATISLPDGQEGTGGVVLIAPEKLAPFSPGTRPTEGKQRVKRQQWGGSGGVDSSSIGTGIGSSDSSSYQPPPPPPPPLPPPRRVTFKASISAGYSNPGGWSVGFEFSVYF